MSTASGSRIRLVLFVLFLFAMAYQVALSAGIMVWLARGADRGMRPFGITYFTYRIYDVSPAAASQGVRAGDELLATDGQPYKGRAVWSSKLRAKHAGETTAFTIRSPGTDSARTVSIRLASPGGIGPLGWPTVITIYVATQFCALLLGFGVALIRPRDPIAWLLLVMMVSFASFSASGDVLRDTIRAWPNGFRQVSLFYHVVVGDVWSICMLLFGIYFAGRLNLDQRAPWLKWLLIIPIGFGALVDGAYHVADSENVATAVALQPIATVTEPISIYLGMAAISLFFFAIWRKAFDPLITPDGRRRLRLVAWGATVALTPLFLVVIQIFILRRTLSANIVLVCVVPLAVFPLSLAYVIVVHRALDVRVVIRQGLQYALAQRGLRVMQALLTMVVIGIAVLVGSQQLRRPQRFTIVGLGGLAIVFMDRGAGKLRGWTDRRFFREAYKTELILNELSENVRTIVESRPLLETVAHQLSGSLHVKRIAILVKRDGAFRTEYALGYETPPEVVLTEDSGIARRLKRERKAQLVYFDDADSWIYAADGANDAERDTLRALDAQLLLPLAYKDELAGVIVLAPKQSEEPYSPSDIRLLESVATQTAMALDNSRLTEAVAVGAAQRERMNRELEIAREVQERLFPQGCPPISGLDCSGRCRPALGVGGDYYDWLELPDGGLGIAIGDVSGKGVPAALLMASLQASLRSQVIAGPTNLAALMSNLNRLVYEATPANRYATFFYAQYHQSRRRLDYVNGGHNPPMLFRRSEVIRLDQGGPPVGLLSAARYTQACIDLQSGDVLVLFTDGVSEAMNAADEEWDEDRLVESVRKCANLTATLMLDAIVRDADEFVAGAAQHDDMTLMAVKVG
ncbi:MAG: SpoIIE family protein phosphatase [Acidobacteriota bacterium]|nr:SpoIIE family protein phosphatase [Acidobacteriota bacterium]